MTYTTPRSHIAVIGALISVLCVVTSPVTQLMIQYQDRPVALAPSETPSNGSMSATVPATQHYQSRVGLTGSWSLDLAGHVSAGLVHPPSDRIAPLTPGCPSGACVWPRFQSLGLCARAADVSDRLRVRQLPFSTPRDWTAWDATADGDGELKLNGTLAYDVSLHSEVSSSSNQSRNDADVPLLNFVTPVSYTLYSGPLSRSVAFAGDAALARARVASYAAVWAAGGNDTFGGHNATRPDPWEFRAAELLYYACVNTYDVAVADGVASTTATPSYDVVTTGEDADASLLGAVVMNCTTPQLVSGGARMTDCVYDEHGGAAGVGTRAVTLRGSGEAGTLFAHDNFTADIGSLTLLARYVTQDSSGIWAWDGVGVNVVAGNQGVPTLADAVYGFMPDGEGRRQTLADKDTQLARLATVAENIAVSITNGRVPLSLSAHQPTPFLLDSFRDITDH